MKIVGLIETTVTSSKWERDTRDTSPEYGGMSGERSVNVKHWLPTVPRLVDTSITSLYHSLRALPGWGKIHGGH